MNGKRQNLSIITNLHSRSATRYLLAVPVSFWWCGPNECVHAGQGITQDISISGVLIVVDSCPPPVGVLIELAIVLPRLGGSGNGMELHGEGTVVRFDSNSSINAAKQVAHFAVSVLFHPSRADASDELLRCATKQTGTTYCN